MANRADCCADVDAARTRCLPRQATLMASTSYGCHFERVRARLLRLLWKRWVVAPKRPASGPSYEYQEYGGYISTTFFGALEPKTSSGWRR